MCFLGVTWKCLEVFLIVSTEGREARDAAKHPTNAQGSPTAKNYLIQNVSRAAVEKPDLDGLSMSYSNVVVLVTCKKLRQ